MTHELKTWSEYFNAIRGGQKTFEIRNDDRGFKVGDLLVLKEYDPQSDAFTGQVEHRIVTYCLRCNGQFGLADGHVIMAIVKPQSTFGSGD